MLKFNYPNGNDGYADIPSTWLFAELTVDGEAAVATIDEHGRLVIVEVETYPREERRWGVPMDRVAKAVLNLREAETLPALLNLGFTQI